MKTVVLVLNSVNALLLGYLIPSSLKIFAVTGCGVSSTILLFMLLTPKDALNQHRGFVMVLSILLFLLGLTCVMNLLGSGNQDHAYSLPFVLGAIVSMLATGALSFRYIAREIKAQQSNK
jgi:uncharacterized protein YebE (UPF0316 family)